MPELIDTPADAEVQAGAWMRDLGFADALPTVLGGDGGVDVVATRAVAQVKFQVRPAGRPELQNLVGAAQAHPGKLRLFFSWKGYSGPALLYAEEAHIALFSYGLDGSFTPANTLAEHRCSLAPASSSVVLPPPVAPPVPVPSPSLSAADWFTPRRVAIGVGAIVLLLLVVFFATHPDALARLVGGLAAVGLCLIGLKMTFTKPRRRRRSRPRRR